MPLIDGSTRTRQVAQPLRHPSTESFPDRFHAPPHIICAQHGDAVALLDRRSGQYVTLDVVGGRIWRHAAAGDSVGELVERLEREYDVAREQLVGDVGRTLEQLLAAGLLAQGLRTEPGERSPAANRTLAITKGSTPTRIPSVLRCGFTIMAVKTSLRIRGFERTLASIRRRVESVAPAAPASVDAVKRSERAVATASAFYPGRAQCLEQSLALYYLLRRQGVAVRYCQGVQFHPFQAHAWVEYEGEVINDVEPHVKHFARFPDQLP